MLAGIKLIPREKLPEHEEDNLSTDKRTRKARRKQEEHYHNSSNEDKGSERDERHARQRKKKMRSASCSATDSDSFEGLTCSNSSKGDKHSKSRNKRSCPHEKGGRKKEDRIGRRNEDQSRTVNEKKCSDGDIVYMIDHNNGILRKEMGLEWMLQAGNNLHGNPASTKVNQEEDQVEEGKKVNPKELNPYLQDNGSGYPNDALNSAAGSSQLISSSLVGDGGASWRLKALKRAKEQAAREGLTLQEVVGERWGSLQELATSVAGHRSAPARAHLHAIKERKKGHSDVDETRDKLFNSNDVLPDLSSGRLDMKKPKQDNLQWRSKNLKKIRLEDGSLASEAVSYINKFPNDGNFMNSIVNQHNKDSNVHEHFFPGTKEAKDIKERDIASKSGDFAEAPSTEIEALSSNQLAAKVLQLRMKGKHEEAENLSKHMDLLVDNSNARSKATRQEAGGSTNRFIEKQLPSGRKKHEDDGDKHLAQKIIQNRRYSMSENADDEYDFYEGAPSRKHSKKKDVTREDKINLSKRILTQKERCQFCFENPSRPKHLVISLGNVTYMMLSPWEPVIEGHCCILPLQHESATRTIDKNVWEEIRNFKKCLLKMFSRQDKDAIFLETVIGLSSQRRHCLIECIPIPSHIAKQAPLYFKKAIDEAEDEWGQHDMKKVIPTSGNLRNVIPENFSYFHVEFGLDRGFVHVIDDDSNFPSSFGLNVVRGMLRLPVETMHHHRRREPVEKQKQAVATFVQEWEPFDWTKELD